MMEGRFTAPEYQTALEDRIIAFRRQQFQQMVEMQFKQWQGLNGIIDQSSNAFGRLGSGMQNFGAQVDRASGFLHGMGGGGGNINWSGIAAAFNTQAAQRDMLFNEMQMLLQYLPPAAPTRPGSTQNGRPATRTASTRFRES